MRRRLISKRIVAAKTSVLLLGPRQVGKSTLCRSLDAGLYVDLADEADYLAYAKDPARLRRELEAVGDVRLVVVDEIQRVPSLLNTVQSVIDRGGRVLKFVLTGSSARKLKRGGANLLPGRVVLERMDPLSVLEIDEPLDLDRALRLGMLPGVYDGGEEAADILGTYAEVYLREEIRSEALAKNLGSYARFLDVMAVASGGWVNYSKLSSDSEIPKETFRRFVEVLEDTLLAFRIPAFQPRTATSRRVSQRDRLLLFDVGVRNGLLGLHRHRLAADQLGGLFEQWVMLQVIYLNHATRGGWKLHSYRTESGAEVDLVIEREDDFIGLEVKYGRQVSVTDTRGLLSLQEVIGKRKPFQKWIVYNGERKQKFDNGVEAWPVSQALRALV
jgi:uncharacterized protein